MKTVFMLSIILSSLNISANSLESLYNTQEQIKIEPVSYRGKSIIAGLASEVSGVAYQEAALKICKSLGFFRLVTFDYSICEEGSTLTYFNRISDSRSSYYSGTSCLGTNSDYNMTKYDSITCAK